eukprot:2614926-Pleurochrysis_carterae.AAC.5
MFRSTVLPPGPRLSLVVKHALDFCVLKTFCERRRDLHVSSKPGVWCMLWPQSGMPNPYRSSACIRLFAFLWAEQGSGAVPAIVEGTIGHERDMLMAMCFWSPPH